MSAAVEEFQRLRAYMGSSRELTQWIAGAKALALLVGAVESGVLDALGTKRTGQEIADVTGMDRQRVDDLCLALEEHGVVQRDGESYELAPDFALLSSPSAAVPLAHAVRYAMVMIRALQTSTPAGVTYPRTPPEDILAMAMGSGISALSSSPHVGQDTIAQVMPEVEAAWQAGARHLEVGCGVGNALLGTVTTYPHVTAVGIEKDELTAAEAERRAQSLGVADRTEVWKMDACDLQDEQAYDTVQWSQFFFPTASRPVVLRAIHRALRPGGYLFMPWFGPVPDHLSQSRREKLRVALRAWSSGSASYLAYLTDILGDTSGRREKERRSAAINRVLFGQWGVPVRSVRELESEVAESGFRIVRAVPVPVSQFVLTRGLLLAQRDGL